MSAQYVPSSLTDAEIQQLIDWNETGDPNNIINVYDYLSSKGDEYADNAKEVVLEALTGVAPTRVVGAAFGKGAGVVGATQGETLKWLGR
jgi:hypothetical protein